VYKSISLTEDEMTSLDDGQGWYKPGDDVVLGGYLPDDNNNNPAFDLSVNGETVDNWAHWGDMPEWLRERFTILAARSQAAADLRSIPSAKRSAASKANGRKGGRPKGSQASRITRQALEAWLIANRPDLDLYEDNASGQKGHYRQDAGPAASFHACGDTWRDVAVELGMIEPVTRD
jgi:hypothetical protein